MKKRNEKKWIYLLPFIILLIYTAFVIGQDQTFELIEDGTRALVQAGGEVPAGTDVPVEPVLEGTSEVSFSINPGKTTLDLNGREVPIIVTASQEITVARSNGEFEIKMQGGTFTRVAEIAEQQGGELLVTPESTTVQINGNELASNEGSIIGEKAKYIYTPARSPGDVPQITVAGQNKKILVTKRTGNIRIDTEIGNGNTVAFVDGTATSLPMTGTFELSKDRVQLITTEYAGCSLGQTCPTVGPARVSTANEKVTVICSGSCNPKTEPELVLLDKSSEMPVTIRSNGEIKTVFTVDNGWFKSGSPMSVSVTAGEFSLTQSEFFQRAFGGGNIHFDGKTDNSAVTIEMMTRIKEAEGYAQSGVGTFQPTGAKLTYSAPKEVALNLGIQETDFFPEGIKLTMSHQGRPVFFGTADKKQEVELSLNKNEFWVEGITKSNSRFLYADLTIPTEIEEEPPVQIAQN